MCAAALSDDEVIFVGGWDGLEDENGQVGLKEAHVLNVRTREWTSVGEGNGEGFI